MWPHYIWYRIKLGTQLTWSLRPLWLGQGRSYYGGGGAPAFTAAHRKKRLRPDFQLMRLRACLESQVLIVGFTRVHTFVTWDSHELTHNLTGSHAQTDIPTKVDLLTPSLQHGDYGPGSTNNTQHRITPMNQTYAPSGQG